MGDSLTDVVLVDVFNLGIQGPPGPVGPIGPVGPTGTTGQTPVTATGTPMSRTLEDRFADVVNVKDFGAVFDGNSHPLSAYYSTLAAAQAVYPFAVALTDEIDGVATQAAINLVSARVSSGVWSYGGEVRVPAGCGLINQPLLINTTTVSLRAPGGGFEMRPVVDANSPSAVTALKWTGAARTAGQGQINMLTVRAITRRLTACNVLNILFNCNGVVGCAGPLFASVAHASIDIATQEPRGIPYTGSVLTAGSQTITVPTTAGVRVGESIVSASLPEGCYVASIVDGTHLTASAQALATSTETVTIGGEGVRFDCVSGLADVNDTQFLEVSFYGQNLNGALNASAPLLLMGGTGTTGGQGGLAFGNVSGNFFNFIRCISVNATGMVMNNTDHNHFRNVSLWQIGSASIVSGTYTTGTGAVSLTTAAPHGISVGGTFTINAAQGAGAGLGTINDSWVATAGTGGTTLNFTIPASLTITSITGGRIIQVSSLVSNGSLDPNNSCSRYNNFYQLGATSAFKMTGTETGGFTIPTQWIRINYGVNVGTINPIPIIGTGVTAMITSDTSPNSLNYTNYFVGTSAHFADGTVAGGNTRGHFAVDMQTNRAAATQIASGLNSVISGGFNNTASGDNSCVAGGSGNTTSGTYSTVLNGVNCTASASYAVASGSSALADLYAVRVHSGGLIASGKHVQSGQQILRANTAANTTPVRLTADQGVASTINCVNLLANGTYNLSVQLVALDSTTAANSYVWTQPIGLLKRQGAVSTVTYAPGTPVILASGTTAGIAVTEAADTTTGGYNITFTPPTGNAVIWRAAANVTWTRVDD